MRYRTHSRQGWIGAAALLALLATLAGAPAVFADGSATMFPTDATCTNNASGGSCRASLEWRNNFYGPAATPIQRRTLFHVYAQQSEVIFLGSSALGQGNGAIRVWNPGVVSDAYASTTGLPAPSFSCSTTPVGGVVPGYISSRAQELAGAGGTGGYTPCTYAVPSTGIYSVAFVAPDGDTGDTDGNTGALGDITMPGSGYFDANQRSDVSAWEISVRPFLNSPPSPNAPGRVFTYSLVGITGDNGRPVNVSMYVVTTDGYRYKTDTRGLDPWGFAFYGNPNGFFDSDGVTPLNHDVRGLSGGVGVGNMKQIEGSLTFDRPRYPIFFTSPANQALSAIGIPTAPTAPQITNLDFSGSSQAQTLGWSGKNTLVSTGGTFSITANAPGIYEIVVARDPTTGGPPASAETANYDPGLPMNRVLRREFTSAGTQTIAWDGKDNVGNDFPIGLAYPFKARVRGGEYHFPLLDAESSPLGGPTFTVLNAPGPLCDGCTATTGNFDDRGYQTIAGVAVGTPGSPLCGAGKPASPYHSDWETGFDTSGNSRAYGFDSKLTAAGVAANLNQPCTGNDATDSAFGDLKGLDVWTFFPSAIVQADLNILDENTPPPLSTSTTTGGPPGSDTPEADSLLLFGGGLAGLAGYGRTRWRARRRHAGS